MSFLSPLWRTGMERQEFETSTFRNSLGKKTFASFNIPM
jgi:hypothetical protein